MIIFISGKMTGLPNLGKESFDEAEKKLETKGHIVLNPAKLPQGLDRTKYMPISFSMIDACDAIYMLKSYIDSPGADIEFKYAMYQGKTVLFEGLSDEQL